MGSGWDKLFAKDTTGKLTQLMMEVVDGDYLTFKSKNGAYVREHFFGRYPETAALVADMTDDEIWALRVVVTIQKNFMPHSIKRKLQVNLL